MKKLLYFLGPLFATVAVAYFVNQSLEQFDSPGYVLIGIGHWSMETSLVVFAVSQVIVFYLLYLLFRSLGYLLRLPGQLKNRGKNIKFNRHSQTFLELNLSGCIYQSKKMVIIHGIFTPTKTE